MDGGKRKLLFIPVYLKNSNPRIRMGFSRLCKNSSFFRLSNPILIDSRTLHCIQFQHESDIESYIRTTDLYSVQMAETQKVQERDVKMGAISSQEADIPPPRYERDVNHHWCWLDGAELVGVQGCDCTPPKTGLDNLY